MLSGLQRLVRPLVPPLVIDLIWRWRISRLQPPDPELYRPVFEPWQQAEFQSFHGQVRERTLLSPAGCWVLSSLLRQALAVPGVVYEAGVYRGGSALLLHLTMAQAGVARPLRLFDTFSGMPDTDRDRDRHVAGDFGDTTLEGVRDLFPAALARPAPDIRPGFLPETFAGLEQDIVAFAHVDLDIYRSIMDACDFIYPRMPAGGVMVFDDYGFPSCPGARAAVDQFFSDKSEVPLVLQTGQAIVHRLPESGSP